MIVHRVRLKLCGPHLKKIVKKVIYRIFLFIFQSNNQFKKLFCLFFIVSDLYVFHFKIPIDFPEFDPKLV